MKSFTPDSAEAVNVRIAELLGAAWKFDETGVTLIRLLDYGVPVTSGGSYQTNQADDPEPVKHRKRIAFIARQVPNYSGSLDAMHEAEKTLTEEQMSEYIDALNEAVGHDNPNGHAYWLVFNATAAQRARAFIAIKTRTNL